MPFFCFFSFFWSIFRFGIFFFFFWARIYPDSDVNSGQMRNYRHFLFSLFSFRSYLASASSRLLFLLLFAFFRFLFLLFRISPLVQRPFFRFFFSLLRPHPRLLPCECIRAILVVQENPMQAHAGQVQKHRLSRASTDTS